MGETWETCQFSNWVRPSGPRMWCEGRTTCWYYEFLTKGATYFDNACNSHAFGPPNWVHSLETPYVDCDVVGQTKDTQPLNLQPGRCHLFLNPKVGRILAPNPPKGLKGNFSRYFWGPGSEYRNLRAPVWNLRCRVIGSRITAPKTSQLRLCPGFRF